MSLSLYVIEDSLAQLAEAREAAEAEGDSEAIAVIDKEIAAYLTREVAKVDSYAGLIRRRLDDAKLLKAEAARLADRAKVAEADADRLKETALRVMQQFGVKELKTQTNTLRVQGNGGLEALDVEPELLPRSMKLITVTMPLNDWFDIRPGQDTPMAKRISTRSLDPNSDAIREALKQRVPCPECYERTAANSGVANANCERCNGSGTVPNTVPGARLLPRGSHVRLS